MDKTLYLIYLKDMFKLYNKFKIKSDRKLKADDFNYLFTMGLRNIDFNKEADEFLAKCRSDKPKPSDKEMFQLIRMTLTAGVKQDAKYINTNTRR